MCGRRTGFRIGAVLLGLAPLVVCEGVLRLGGWGRDLPTGDPRVEFDPSRPLFELHEAEGLYRTAANRTTYFVPQSFPATKAANEFRIFVLGGSTVQGRPFSTATAFPTWLQLGLQAADDHTRWTVVNCGGVSYASYRLLPILDEILWYQPDLVLVYTGHNEFLEEQMVRAIDDVPAWMRRGQAWWGNWYTYRVLSAWAGTRFAHGPVPSSAHLPVEVDALLDYQGGLAYYERNDALRQRTIEQFERNLSRMVRSCQDSGVPMLLMSPVSNLKDSPPFKSANDHALSPAESNAFSSAWTMARDPDVPWARRHQALRQAVSIDPRHAGAHYLLGLSWWDQGRYSSALEAFSRAKEEDLCPLRVLETMREAIAAASGKLSLPLIDAHALIAERSIGGIPDDLWLLDHVHPSIRGHQLLADSVFSALGDGGYVTLSPGWEDRRERLVKQQFDSLSKSYHFRGQERLLRLRTWARGRSEWIRNTAFEQQ